MWKSGSLDDVIPSCYVSVLFLMRSFDAAGAKSALTDLLSQKYPFLLGRLEKKDDGSWQIAGESGGLVWEERESNLALENFGNAHFHEWPDHDFALWIDASKPSFIMKIVCIRLKNGDGFAIVLHWHHNVLDVM